MPEQRGTKRRKTRQQRQAEKFRNEVLLPLLSMFSVVDDVFTEDDAFDEMKRKIGYGRIYEEWKRCRSKLDPEFDPRVDERPQRWLPKKVREARRARSARE